MSLFVVGCAKRQALSPALAALDAPSVAARLRSAHTSVERLTADAQLTYFGSRGRLRLQATAAMTRAGAFRIVLLGPHGGPLGAAGCDGATLWQMDLANMQAKSAEATARGLSRLLGRSDLEITPAAIVALLWGEIPLDARAVCTSQWDAVTGAFVLHCEEEAQREGDLTGDAIVTQVKVDPVTWQAREATFTRAAWGALHLKVRERGAMRLATSTLITWEPISGEKETLEMELKNIDSAPSFADEAFSLKLPSQMTHEVLD